MRIEAHDKFGKPINTTVTRIVIYDDYDNPIGLAFEQQKDWIYIGHLRDPEFTEYLKQLGINKFCVVDVLRTKDLRPIKKQ